MWLNPTQAAELDRMLQDAVLISEKIEEERRIVLDYLSNAIDDDLVLRKFWIRNMFRILFAEMEAAISMVGGICYAMHKSRLAELNPEEIIMLEREQYRYQNGRFALAPVKSTLTDNLLFVNQLLAKIFEFDPLRLEQDSQWSLLRTTIKVRHRLMHPKVASELDVTIAEAQDLGAVEDWFREKLFEMMDRATKKMERDYGFEAERVSE